MQTDFPWPPFRGQGGQQGAAQRRSSRTADREKSKSGGRNNNGRITTRHVGGGHKQHYRLVDFRRNDKDGIPATVERIEYDPNRTAHIALLCYADGERRYIIAPKGVSAGDQLIAGALAPIKAGNSLQLRNIPVGSTIHGIELKPGKGAQIARSAGASAQLIAREGVYVTLRLRSGEMRKVLAECRATWAKSRTPSTACVRWVKLVPNAGAAFAQPFVVLP